MAVLFVSFSCGVFLLSDTSGAAAREGSRSGGSAAGARARTELRVLLGVSHHLRPKRRLPGEEGTTAASRFGDGGVQGGGGGGHIFACFSRFG